ncbi:MAG: DDE-type integrase/transposase/recombinase [bacterium]
MPFIKTTVQRPNCPKCGSSTHCFGLDKETKLQKFRCKNPNCRKQFAPGKPTRQKKYPSFKCPKCGSPMSIFKHLSDGFRLRCNNHIYHDQRHCSHKINIPLPGKQFKIAKDPIESIQVNLPINFTYSKMHYSKDTVSLALYFSIFMAIPAKQVSQMLDHIFKVAPSHDTITRWSHKGVLSLHKNLGPLSVPFSLRKKLFTDETQFKQRGQKRWLWLTKDSKFDSLQSWFLSPRRSTQFARSTFNIAFENSPALKSAKIITDGLWSYPSALEDLNFDVHKNHLRYIGFFEHPLNNNNRLERHWSTLKVKARPFRGFKSERGLWCFITGQIYLHNYFQPNQRLKGLTPAETAGVKLPYCHSKWKLFTRFF